MSFLRRIFDARARQALEAEVGGDLRRAAYLWNEIGDGERAADLMVRAGEREIAVDARLGAWREALRFAPEGAKAKRADIEARIGTTVLDGARAGGGVTTVEARKKLEDAAERLERAERWASAADAWEMVGRLDDLARCLERGGEIERLERVLERSASHDRRATKLRSLLEEQELALRVGAREMARKALRDAVNLAPDDPAVASMLRHLEERWPRGRRIRLTIDGARVGLAFRLPVVVGRADADVVVRGGSVSRRHCEIAARGAELIVRDLGSRNGTLVRGLPIANELSLRGETELGLGEDVALRLAPSPHGVLLEVVRGLDRGERTVAGEGALRVDGLSATFTHEGDRVVLRADAGVAVVLGAQQVAAEIDLLSGDVLSIGASRVEVLAE